MDQGISDTGACTGSDSRYQEECNPDFHKTLVLRCEAYSVMYTFNKGIFILACLTFVINLFLAAVMLMPSGPLANARHMVLPATVLVAIYMMLGVLIWCYMSDHQFKILGKKSQFPYPSLNSGFFVFLLSSFSTIGGGALTFPEFSGTAPKGGDPLLAEEEDAAGSGSDN